MRRRDILAVVAGSACFLPLAGVAQQRATAPPPASACQERLTPDVVVMHPLPSITGPGSCGAEDVVSLDAVVLKDGQRLALAPAATLRCPMAEAVAHWIREDVAPAAAATFGSPARTIVAGVSYECRGRDRIPDAKLSEHAHANALDLRGLKLANGKVVDFTDKAVIKEFRDTVRQSACGRFTTVLGPGSDSYHERQIHLDLIERQSGYRLCQWDVQTASETPSAPALPEGRGPVTSTK
ncbi:MAG: extensin family protein [Alphaproteobacteria bacterium]|nr:MAG: extensin family protein [Alphaproteobacteria bacterium]